MFRKMCFFIIIVLATFTVAQEQTFVEVTTINPNIQLDIRYATENNFLNRVVYPQARCFVRYPVGIKLDSIQQELESIGLGLKIFDGYRPLSVQKQMWEILPDDQYVANPQNGSRHNRGAAVDVSLVDFSGSELPMPTEYDDFTEKAAHAYQNLPAEIRRNRWILKTIMEKYGFTPIKSEWWHYDLKGWEIFPISDLSFEEIEQMNAHSQSE